MVYTFETIVILNENITEEEYNLHINMLRDYLIYNTKKLYKTDKLGMKRLAYEIKKCKQGWYIVFTYAAESDFITEFEKVLRADEQVIKFMSIKMREPYEEDTPNAEYIISDEVESEQQDAAVTPVDIFDMIYGQI